MIGTRKLNIRAYPTSKVWQISACDAASSDALARVFVQPQPTYETAAHCLQHVLVPFYPEAGWPAQRVLTDRGGEFAGTLFEGLPGARDQPHQSPPRHAWTNGFVERLPGTNPRPHPGGRLARSPRSMKSRDGREKPSTAVLDNLESRRS